jgi:pimeloyl-ACP methyl ester carboxylesterase
MAFASLPDLDIAWDARGPADAPPVLLVMGLGMPAAMWPDAFVDALLVAGYRVVTFDNRDCGASTHLAHLPVPNIPVAMARALMRRRVEAPYSLEDMASDTIAVLDAAGIASAHVVGVSMGGMISQVLAARFPQRVRTLTSIMSSSGNPHPRVALGSPVALRALLHRPPGNPDDLEAVVQHLTRVFGVIGSPGFRQTADELRPHLWRVACCGLYEAGTMRQLGAILASGDRRKLLQAIRVPTLVIHGAADPLVPVAAGRDTAAHVPGAQLEIIDGMGHDFPPRLMTTIATRVAAHCRSFERQFEPELTAATGLAAGADAPAERLDQGACEREAEPVAPVPPPAGGIAGAGAPAP